MLNSYTYINLCVYSCPSTMGIGLDWIAASAIQTLETRCGSESCVYHSSRYSRITTITLFHLFFSSLLFHSLGSSLVGPVSNWNYIFPSASLPRLHEPMVRVSILLCPFSPAFPFSAYLPTRYQVIIFFPSYTHFFFLSPRIQTNKCR